MAAKIPWIGTSWKMNKMRAEARSFAEAVAGAQVSRSKAARLFVIPPFLAVADTVDILAGTRVAVGVQNVHWADAGAWTGEVSPAMVRDVGATLAEIGHSERRTHFGETDATVALKTAAAIRHGLVPLVCVGDTRAEFDAGETGAVLRRQVAAALSKVDAADRTKVMIAYEPVWSIGEGGTPAQPGFANTQHALIKAFLRDSFATAVPVLYGGSVNPDNCCALAGQPEIDGLFIGRSAWQAEGYLGIVDSVLQNLSGNG